MSGISTQVPIIKSKSDALVRRSSRFFSSAGALGGKPKRIIDILLSGLALVFLSPVFVILALAVKICDHGPILFTHQRVGYSGKPFGCLKFRTMCVDAEPQLSDYLQKCPAAAAEWQASQKLKSDPRLTRIGAALRRSSFDELPQLINVLRGEMSLVGPRPIVVEEMARYGHYLQFYLSARPGLTGAWQVSGRNDVSYAARVGLDVEYYKSWSLKADLLIVLHTIPALFSRHGSY